MRHIGALIGETMICLKVSINGAAFCVAGVGDHGCISAFVTWVDIEGDAGEPALPNQPGDVLLNVSGFTADQSPVHWRDIAHHLAVGDTVTVEVVDLASADPPKPTPMLPEIQENEA